LSYNRAQQADLRIILLDTGSFQPLTSSAPQVSEDINRQLCDIGLCHIAYRGDNLLQELNSDTKGDNPTSTPDLNMVKVQQCIFGDNIIVFNKSDLVNDNVLNLFKSKIYPEHHSTYIDNKKTVNDYHDNKNNNENLVMKKSTNHDVGQSTDGTECTEIDNDKRSEDVASHKGADTHRGEILVEQDGKKVMTETENGGRPHLDDTEQADICFISCENGRGIEEFLNMLKKKITKL